MCISFSLCCRRRVCLTGVTVVWYLRHTTKPIPHRPILCYSRNGTLCVRSVVSLIGVTWLQEKTGTAYHNEGDIPDIEARSSLHMRGDVIDGIRSMCSRQSFVLFNRLS